MKDVIVVIAAGSIGQAFARRVSAGTHGLLADLRQENVDAAARTLTDAGFDVRRATVDVTSRASVRALIEVATAPGGVFGVIRAAGAPPSHASPEAILKVDLYGPRGNAGTTLPSRSRSGPAPGSAGVRPLRGPSCAGAAPQASSGHPGVLFE